MIVIQISYFQLLCPLQAIKGHFFLLEFHMNFSLQWFPEHYGPSSCITIIGHQCPRYRTSLFAFQTEWHCINRHSRTCHFRSSMTVELCFNMTLQFNYIKGWYFVEAKLASLSKQWWLRKPPRQWIWPQKQWPFRWDKSKNMSVALFLSRRRNMPALGIIYQQHRYLSQAWCNIILLCLINNFVIVIREEGNIEPEWLRHTIQIGFLKNEGQYFQQHARNKRPWTD